MCFSFCIRSQLGHGFVCEGVRRKRINDYKVRKTECRFIDYLSIVFRQNQYGFIPSMDTCQGWQALCLVFSTSSFELLSKIRLSNNQLLSDFSWLRRLLITAVFGGDHTFHIEQLARNRVRFLHQQKLSGMLVPLAWGIGGTLIPIASTQHIHLDLAF